MKEYTKNMIYSSFRTNAERIANGTYKGFDYYVLSLGTHPCAYIDVSETLLNGVDYSDIDILCHGGLTYSRDYLDTVDKKGWFIGWDYAHYNDFAGYEMNFPFDMRTGGIGMPNIEQVTDYLIANGVIVLPCKVGDTAHRIDAERVYESKIRNIIYDTDSVAFDERAIGKSIFLSREEAEKELERRKTE